MRKTFIILAAVIFIAVLYQTPPVVGEQSSNSVLSEDEALQRAWHMQENALSMFVKVQKQMADLLKQKGLTPSERQKITALHNKANELLVTNKMERAGSALKAKMRFDALEQVTKIIEDLGILINILSEKSDSQNEEYIKNMLQIYNTKRSKIKNFVKRNKEEADRQEALTELESEIEKYDKIIDFEKNALKKLGLITKDSVKKELASAKEKTEQLARLARERQILESLEEKVSRLNEGKRMSQDQLLKDDAKRQLEALMAVLEKLRNIRMVQQESLAENKSDALNASEGMIEEKQKNISDLAKNIQDLELAIIHQKEINGELHVIYVDSEIVSGSKAIDDIEKLRKSAEFLHTLIDEELHLKEESEKKSTATDDEQSLAINLTRLAGELIRMGDDVESLINDLNGYVFGGKQDPDTEKITATRNRFVSSVKQVLSRYKLLQEAHKDNTAYRGVYKSLVNMHREIATGFKDDSKDTVLRLERFAVYVSDLREFVGNNLKPLREKVPLFKNELSALQLQIKRQTDLFCKDNRKTVFAKNDFSNAMSIINRHVTSASEFMDAVLINLDKSDKPTAVEKQNLAIEALRKGMSEINKIIKAKSTLLISTGINAAAEKQAENRSKVLSIAADVAEVAYEDTGAKAFQASIKLSTDAMLGVGEYLGLGDYEYAEISGDDALTRLIEARNKLMDLKVQKAGELTPNMPDIMAKQDNVIGALEEVKKRLEDQSEKAGDEKARNSASRANELSKKAQDAMKEALAAMKAGSPRDSIPRQEDALSRLKEAEKALRERAEHLAGALSYAKSKPGDNRRRYKEVSDLAKDSAKAMEKLGEKYGGEDKKRINEAKDHAKKAADSANKASNEPGNDKSKSPSPDSEKTKNELNKAIDYLKKMEQKLSNELAQTNSRMAENNHEKACKNAKALSSGQPSEGGKAGQPGNKNKNERVSKVLNNEMKKAKEAMAQNKIEDAKKNIEDAIDAFSRQRAELAKLREKAKTKIKENKTRRELNRLDHERIAQNIRNKSNEMKQKGQDQGAKDLKDIADKMDAALKDLRGLKPRLGMEKLDKVLKDIKKNIDDKIAELKKIGKKSKLNKLRNLLVEITKMINQQKKINYITLKIDKARNGGKLRSRVDQFNLTRAWESEEKLMERCRKLHDDLLAEKSVCVEDEMQNIWKDMEYVVMALKAMETGDNVQDAQGEILASLDMLAKIIKESYKEHAKKIPDSQKEKKKSGSGSKSKKEKKQKPPSLISQTAELIAIKYKQERLCQKVSRVNGLINKKPSDGELKLLQTRKRIIRRLASDQDNLAKLPPKLYNKLFAYDFTVGEYRPLPVQGVTEKMVLAKKKLDLEDVGSATIGVQRSVIRELAWLIKKIQTKPQSNQQDDDDKKGGKSGKKESDVRKKPESGKKGKPENKKGDKPGDAKGKSDKPGQQKKPGNSDGTGKDAQHQKGNKSGQLLDLDKQLKKMEDENWVKMAIRRDPSHIRVRAVDEFLTKYNELMRRYYKWISKNTNLDK